MHQLTSQITHIHPEYCFPVSPIFFHKLVLFYIEHSHDYLVQLRLKGNKLDWFVAVITTKTKMRI
jgi:hypothetical protein